MKKIFLFACVLVFVFLTSCKKDDIILKNTVLLVDPSDPTNPYDNTGELHNKGLDYFAKEGLFDSRDIFKSSYFSSANQFLIDNNITADNAKIYMSLQKSLWAGWIQDTAKINSDALAIMSKEELKFYSDLKTAYLKMSQETLKLTNKEIITEMLKVVKAYQANIEKYIVDEESLNRQLCGISVLNWSTAYWLSDNNANGGAPLMKKWWQIALADAAGALTGASVGSSIPGVGTAAGAVVGAVIASADCAVN